MKLLKMKYIYTYIIYIYVYIYIYIYIYTHTNQHSVPKLFNPNVTNHQHSQNFTNQLYIYISAKLVFVPTTKILKIEKTPTFKNPLKSTRQWIWFLLKLKLQFQKLLSWKPFSQRTTWWTLVWDKKNLS